MGTGFLDQYGVAEQKREGIVKKIILISLLVIIVVTTGYFYFRTWSQERVMKDFLAALQRKDETAAYALWCTAEVPCKYYDSARFNEDWGPKSPYANAGGAKIQSVEYCDSVVLFNVSFPGSDEPIALHVVRSTG